MENTILKVTENSLCSGCGTCIALCPNKAIKMNINHVKGIYIPIIEEKKCNNCEKCYNICPGRHVDFRQLNLEIFSKEPENFLVGNYLNCYIGCSKDYDIRFHSSSGGLITQILIYALEEGIINGVIVTKMSKDHPLEPDVFIARTTNEIIEASKSKYCPVPVNVCLEEILKTKKEEKFAVVGLPCHIHGIRKAETLNKELKGKIVLTIGLLCNHVPNFWGTEIFLKKFNLNKSDIKELNYRGDGWPGTIGILKENGEKNMISYSDFWNFAGSSLFYPKRCLMCIDGTSEFSDVSFGDAWLPEFSKDKIGVSIIISRNQISEKILNSMKLDNYIKISKITPERLIRSQLVMLYFKKKSLYSLKKLFKMYPNYIVSEEMKTDLIDFSLGFFFYFNSFLFSKSLMRNILKYVPLKLIRFYHLPHSLISLKKAEKEFMNYINSTKD